MSDGSETRTETPVQRYDRVAPIAASSTLFAYLFAVSYARAWSLAGSYDLGYFSHAAWLIAHGHEPFMTIRGLHLLGDHASLILYPMAWLAGHAMTIPLLLAIQAAAISIAAFPLWRLSRRCAGLTVGASIVVLVLYAAYPTVHNIALFDFHPESVAIPALIGAVYFALGRRWVPYGACVVVALLCREDISIAIMFFGVVVAFSVSKKAGIVTAGGALLWFLVATQLIQPHFAGDFVHLELLAAYGDSASEVLTTFVTEPGRVLGDLVTRVNADYAVAMLLPLAALPLLAPRWALPAVPLVVLYLISSRAEADDVLHQYTVVPTAFLFAALPFGLAVGLRYLRRRGASSTAVLRVGALVLVGIASLGFYTWARDSPARHPGQWFLRDTVDHSRLRAVERIPEGASVSASVRMWPLLADREELYGFPAPWSAYELAKDPDALGDRQDGVEWVVLDTADGEQWHGDAEAARVRLVDELHLELVFRQNGILVYRTPP